MGSHDSKRAISIHLLCSTNGEQRFDLRGDPDKQKNLAGNPASASIRHELLELIVLQDYPKTRRNVSALGVH